MKSITTSIVAMAVLFVSSTALANDNSHAGWDRRAATKAVYTMSNAADGNEVLQLERGPGGEIAQTGAFATGGAGLGRGLGSQGSVTLTDDGNWLIAVNAGSNDVSVFYVQRHKLQLFARIASGGQQPISAAYRNGLIYVLNAGGEGNISGFRLTWAGLRAIAGSTQPLSSAQADPAQIAFDPSSGDLVVTEKATHRIVVYPVDRVGRAGAPVVHASAGVTPFGFAFASQSRAFGYDADYLIVSEAAGGAPGASTTSSYALDGTELEVLSAAAPTMQSAACWVATTPDGRYAYTTNAASDSVSAYRVARDGTLTLLDADGLAANTSDGPADAAIPKSGRELLVLNGGSDSISMFAIARDGSLSALGELTGLPATAVGIAAR